MWCGLEGAEWVGEEATLRFCRSWWDLEMGFFGYGQIEERYDIGIDPRVVTVCFGPRQLGLEIGFYVAGREILICQVEEGRMRACMEEITL